MQSFLLWHDLDRLSIVWRSSHSWESLIISDWFQLKWSTQWRIAIHFPSDVFLIVTLQGDEILNGKCSLNDYKVKNSILWKEHKGGSTGASKNPQKFGAKQQSNQ